MAREFPGRAWLVPHWHFQLWLEKPPLALWITATFFRLFGVSSFWARALSAFSGVGLVAIVHASAWRLRGARAAWLATVILLTTFGFLRVTHMGELDALLTVGCMVAVCGLAAVGRGDLRGWYCFWIGFAVAAMTKGAASVTLPLTLAGLWVAGGPELRVLGRRFFLGLLGFLALVLPWHLAMLHLYGRGFVDEYLGMHVLTRATSQMEGHTSHWWYYGLVLLVYALPWLLLYPGALWRGLSRVELRPWAVFAAVTLIFFSVVQTRSPKYIFPAYPALALLTGDWLASWLAGKTKKQNLAALVALVAAFAAGAALRRIPQRHLNEGLNGGLQGRAAQFQEQEAVTLLRKTLATPAAEAEGPILLWQQDAVTQLPALLFVARRPLQQVYLGSLPDTLQEAQRYANPQPLERFVSNQPRLILLDPALEAVLPHGMEFTRIERGTTLEIGTIVQK
ncbi:glycosyltransferase family 39 protein [Silvibacterium acidisoli]|uniref:glycosyltransferase family 39 protein n=1 Tax=Acidobacteriaceae bacterium ZG23-2 TaxID=2883246 RepID=UPI00406C0459